MITLRGLEDRKPKVHLRMPVRLTLYHERYVRLLSLSFMELAAVIEAVFVYTSLAARIQTPSPMLNTTNATG